MITGSHLLIFSNDPTADRDFFRNVLNFPYVDAGEGWLVFRLPPAEIGVHPADPAPPTTMHGERPLMGAVLYFMCDDLQATVKSLQAQNVLFTEPVSAGWGTKTTFTLPSGGEIGLYQPRHKTAFDLK